jgi:hypothetical protein
MVDGFIKSFAVKFLYNNNISHKRSTPYYLRKKSNTTIIYPDQICHPYYRF